MNQTQPPAPTLPTIEHAIQFVGPGQLVHNRAKIVPVPGPTQILVRVEAVGICFSDTKLLKAFSTHLRKARVTGGIDEATLGEIPSYVPGELPTVPGHEVAGRIVVVGEAVTRHAVGERVLVQTDYRHLATPGSNAAFGYNFEGGLQEYVLLDERMIIEPGTGARFLIPVDEAPSGSAVALLEPWACVEASYASRERAATGAGGTPARRRRCGPQDRGARGARGRGGAGCGDSGARRRRPAGAARGRGGCRRAGVRGGRRRSRTAGRIVRRHRLLRRGRRSHRAARGAARDGRRDRHRAGRRPDRAARRGGRRAHPLRPHALGGHARRQRCGRLRHRACRRRAPRRRPGRRDRRRWADGIHARRADRVVGPPRALPGRRRHRRRAPRAPGGRCRTAGRIARDPGRLPQ